MFPFAIIKYLVEKHFVSVSSKNFSKFVTQFSLSETLEQERRKFGKRFIKPIKIPQRNLFTMI